MYHVLLSDIVDHFCRSLLRKPVISVVPMLKWILAGGVFDFFHSDRNGIGNGQTVTRQIPIQEILAEYGIVCAHIVCRELYRGKILCHFLAVFPGVSLQRTSVFVTDGHTRHLMGTTIIEESIYLYVVRLALRTKVQGLNHQFRMGKDSRVIMILG